MSELPYYFSASVGIIRQNIIKVRHQRMQQRLCLCAPWMGPFSSWGSSTMISPHVPADKESHVTYFWPREPDQKLHMPLSGLASGTSQWDPPLSMSCSGDLRYDRLKMALLWRKVLHCGSSSGEVLPNPHGLHCEQELHHHHFKQHRFCFCLFE